MTATLHSPSAIAPIAWATWYSNEDPPTIVEPRKAGLMPRYSASARTANRLWAVAENKPSTSFRLTAQSLSARLVPCAIKSITERPSATWPRSDSATPTIAALPRLSPSILRRLHRNEDRIGRFVTARTMQTKAHAHSDPHLVGRDLFDRSEEHTSELQSPDHLVCRLLLEKKKEKSLLYYKTRARQSSTTN